MFTSQTVSAVDMFRSAGDSSDCGTLYSTASLEKLELCAEAGSTYSPRGCDWCQVLPHRLDNSSSPNPQPYADANTTIKQKPYRCCHFRRYIIRFINKVQGNQRADGIARRKRKTVVTF